MQNIGKNMFCPFVHRLFVHAEFRHQIGPIIGCKSLRQCVQFLEDTRFHLVGSLIGKRNSEDATMRPLLLWIEQQVDIVLRKPVCFARTGRGAIDVEHGVNS